MARQAKPYEEARKDAEAFFRGDSLRTEVFLSRYALRALDGDWLETTPDRMWDRVARTMARPEKDRAFWHREFRKLLEDFKFVPAGRILFGAQNPRAATLFNCYFIPVREDSVDGITRWINEAARTFSLGGGVGTNIDVLRPRGALVRTAGVESSGSASFMEVFSTVTGVMGGSRGRRGALMITTRVDHPDILEFITAKGDPERRQVRNANLSVRITDNFMRTLREEGEVRLWFTTPHERIERAVPARRIWQTLVESAWASAEPGVLFWDTVHRESATQYNGMEVQGVNVCGEIPMEPYGACNLGSLNAAAFVRDPFTERADLDWNGLSEAVRHAVRFLDNVIDVGAPRHALRDQRRASVRSRRVGLGILGMADCFASLNLVYGSGPSLSVLDRLMGAIKEAAYEESIRLAEEKGPFPAFDPVRHLESPYIQRLPEPIRNGIRAKGLRNCALLAVAPTGSISCLAGTSSGIEPIFSLSYLRHVAGQAYKVEHPLCARYRDRHGPSATLPETFATARTIDPDVRVRLQALVQWHVDQSISSTVNLPPETPLSAVDHLYRKAWESGCKGITVFREGTRASVLEVAGRDGVYRAEAVAPLGVCTFCEVPVPKGGRLTELVEIDGSFGEGGGQILRTTLSLSCITGKPVRIFNIRKNRPKPGLMPQHLISVKALARISEAEARGVEPGSTEITFKPGQVTAGEYFFEIGTAGSVVLLLQSLLPPLLFAKTPSRLVLTGGTHVPFSPPFDYLRDVFSLWLARIGVQVSCDIERYGFYPRGGGKITALITPAAEIRGVDLRKKGAVLSVVGRSCVANLPLSIAERQRKAAFDPLAEHSPAIDVATVPSPGKGTFLFLKVDTEAGLAGFSALGSIGKRAEDVGREAAQGALAYIGSWAALDPCLADQLVLFLALSKESSIFTTSQVTNHLVTHLHVVRRILGTRFEIEGSIGKTGTVRLTR